MLRWRRFLLKLFFSWPYDSLSARYAFLLTPYLGGLVKAICDALLGVSLGLFAASHLAMETRLLPGVVLFFVCCSIDIFGNIMIL